MLTDPQQSVIRHGFRRWLAKKIEPPADPVPPTLAEIIEARRMQCALALMDAEAELDAAGCRVAALRIRLKRLDGQCEGSLPHG